MPQSGFTPVQTYSSSTPGNVPLAANLINSTQGAEMAINIADGKLFYKNSSGVVTIIATNGTATIGGSTTQVQYNNGGVLAGSANMTFNGTSLTLANDASIHGLTIGLGGGSVSGNTALGQTALSNASNTGSNLIAIGNSPLNANTSGSQNIAIGLQSLFVNTTGSNNTGVGVQTLLNNTTGGNNTAFGTAALLSNTTASNNTAVGYQAGYSNSTGNYNTFLGNGAGYSNTASNNTYVGQNAGNNTTSGTQNTFVGPSVPGIGGAGIYVTTGSYHTIIGGFSGNNGGLDIRTASNYIVLSDGAGNPRGVFDGSGRFIIGQVTQTDNATLTVNVASGGGNLAIETVANATTTQYAMIFRNANGQVGSISTLASATVFGTASDYRLKENVQPMSGALVTISQLRPVTYDWINDKSKGQGFIAHELQAVVPDCVVGQKDAVDSEGNPVYQNIDTSFLVATLTAAIQELNAKITALEAKLGA